jgi:hypothetical protein
LEGSVFSTSSSSSSVGPPPGSPTFEIDATRQAILEHSNNARIFLVAWSYFVLALLPYENKASLALKSIAEHPEVLNKYIKVDNNPACNIMMLICRNRDLFRSVHFQLFAYIIHHPTFNPVQADAAGRTLLDYLRERPSDFPQRNRSLVADRINDYHRAQLDCDPQASQKVNRYNPTTHSLDSLAHYYFEIPTGLVQLGRLSPIPNLLVTNSRGLSCVAIIKNSINSSSNLLEQLSYTYGRLLTEAIKQCVVNNNRVQFELILTIQGEENSAHMTAINRGTAAALTSLLSLPATTFTDSYPKADRDNVYLFLIRHPKSKLAENNQQGRSIIQECVSKLNSLIMDALDQVVDSKEIHLFHLVTILSFGLKQLLGDANQRGVELNHASHIAPILKLFPHPNTSSRYFDCLFDSFCPDGSYEVLLALLASGLTSSLPPPFSKHSRRYLLAKLGSQPALVSNESFKKCCHMVFQLQLNVILDDSMTTTGLSSLLSSYQAVLDADCLFSMLSAKATITNVQAILIVLKHIHTSWPNESYANPLFLQALSKLPEASVSSFIRERSGQNRQLLQSLCRKLIPHLHDRHAKPIITLVASLSIELERFDTKDRCKNYLIALFVLQCFIEFADAILSSTLTGEEKKAAIFPFFETIETYLLGSGFDYWEDTSPVHRVVCQLADLLFPSMSRSDVLYHKALATANGRANPWVDVYSQESTLPRSPALVIRTKDGLLHIASSILQRAVASVRTGHITAESVWLGCDTRSATATNLPLPSKVMDRYKSNSAVFTELYNYSVQPRGQGDGDGSLAALSVLRAGLLNGDVNNQGTSQRAGNAAFVAIIAFMPWWNALPNVERTRLSVLRHQNGGGGTLGEIIGDLNGNHNRCVNQLGNHLDSLIQINRTKFSAGELTETALNSLADRALVQLEQRLFFVAPKTLAQLTGEAATALADLNRKAGNAPLAPVVPVTVNAGTFSRETFDSQLTIYAAQKNRAQAVSYIIQVADRCELFLPLMHLRTWTLLHQTFLMQASDNTRYTAIVGGQIKKVSHSWCRIEEAILNRYIELIQRCSTRPQLVTARDQLMTRDFSYLRGYDVNVSSTQAKCQIGDERQIVGKAWGKIHAAICEREYAIEHPAQTALSAAGNFLSPKKHTSYVTSQPVRAI